MNKMVSVKEYGIGHRIREARKSMGLRQSDLSAATGFPTSHLSDIERGVITPTNPTLHKIGGIPVIHPDQEIWRSRFNTSIRQICDEGLHALNLYKELQNL
ncbi:MAG: helix-turn-helix transcriptional regulator [Anaerolineales bacterium]|nr:helix-turn-helix transcriptional regulator [Anaerolineales bacterium]